MLQHTVIFRQICVCGCVSTYFWPCIVRWHMTPRNTHSRPSVISMFTSFLMIKLTVSLVAPSINYSSSAKSALMLLLNTLLLKLMKSIDIQSLPVHTNSRAAASWTAGWSTIDAWRIWDETVRFVFSIDLEQKVAFLPGEREVFQYSNSDVEALKACGLPILQRLVIVPVYMSRWQICGGTSESQQINKRAFWTVVCLTEATKSSVRGLVVTNKLIQKVLCSAQSKPAVYSSTAVFF